MATKVLDIRQLVDFIKNMQSGIRKSILKAQVAVIQKAEVYAKQNAKAQFVGRNDRKLSGALLNGIYSGFETSTSGDPEGFIGVRNVPYGAIHEFGSEGLPGGVITPQKAKKLWIPQHKNVGKLTPREFIRLKMQNPGEYYLSDKVAGQWQNPKSKSRRLIPLFFLVDKVKMPARPYLRPALEVAVQEFPNYFSRFVSSEGDV